MWESVELRDIRVFLLLADELHFGRAAAQLDLTQSRVSQIIRTLEARLDCRLFERTSRRVRLTPLGVRLRETVRSPLADLERALAEVHGPQREIRGELRLGMLIATSGGPALIDIIQAFEARHPRCRVQIVEVQLGDVLGPLRRREVDLMAIRLPVVQPDITVGPVLSHDERALAVSTSHRFAASDSVSLEDLAGETVSTGAGLPPEVREGLSPSFTPRGRPIARAEPMGSMAEILAAVARNELVHPTVASLRDYYGRPGVTYVPFNDAPPSESGLIWRTALSSEPLLCAFVAVAQEILDRAPPVGLAKRT